jgi:putative ABC transport system permease protein
VFIPLNYNVRSLLVRKTTTLASALGIALVVFVLASSMMLSNGIEHTLVSTGAPDRAIVLRKGSETELASGIDNPTVGIILSAPGVKKDGTQPLGTGEVVVVITQEKLGTDGKISNVQVRGVTPQSLALRKELKIIEGRPAKPGTDEVVIGKGLVGNYAGMQVGESFELKKNRPVTVVGVFDAGGSAFDSEVWCDLDTLRGTFGREGIVSSVVVQLESEAAYDAFSDTVQHDKQLGLETFRERGYYEKQSQGTRIFITAVGFAITFFFSLGAMIGAMITMYAAISQRSREIGTLQALGFSRFAVLTSFVMESILLALGGAAIGAVASLAMGSVHLSMMNFQTWQEISFSFDPSLRVIVAAMAAGGVMGFLGGLFPAWRAAFTPPIAAMRG